MILYLITPSKILESLKIFKVIVPSLEGAFEILPKHRDGVWGIKIGILKIFFSEYESLLYAVNGGVLTKEGDEIFISTLNAIKGDSFQNLKREMEIFYQNREVSEKRTRDILTKLETDIILGVSFGKKY